MKHYKISLILLSLLIFFSTDLFSKDKEKHYDVVNNINKEVIINDFQLGYSEVKDTVEPGGIDPTNGLNFNIYVKSYFMAKPGLNPSTEEEKKNSESFNDLNFLVENNSSKDIKEILVNISIKDPKKKILYRKEHLIKMDIKAGEALLTNFVHLDYTISYKYCYDLIFKFIIKEIHYI